MKKIEIIVTVALIGIVLPLQYNAVFAAEEDDAQAMEEARVVFNTRGKKNVAIKGYDAVAYHTLEKAVKGSAEFSTEWGDATWYFADQEHLDLFVDEPERYAPQYGGSVPMPRRADAIADVESEGVWNSG